MMKDILIVVPYRDRESHLEKFLKLVPTFFKNANLTFDIVICELQDGGDWNAGLCNNSIIHYLNNTPDQEYQYIYIHHVDVYPVEGNLPLPNENECIYNLGDYGSCIMHLQKFLQCGGYGNDFWGWGSEDNDLYKKLEINGIKTINLESIDVADITFDIEFQNHPRPFVGKNYAHNVTLLYYPNSSDMGLYDFYKYGEVVNIQTLEENIYKQIIRPTRISPRETQNNKAIITYVDTHESFNYIATIVKSGMLYSSRDYDMIIFVSEELIDSHLAKEARAFGVSVVPHKKIINTTVSMAGIERFYAYKNFLNNNTQYEKILHVDAADVLVLRNPFTNIIDSDKINFIQEDVLHKHEPWNLRTLSFLKYSEEIHVTLYDCPVICSGVIYGTAKLFLRMTDCILQEYETKSNMIYYGIDQPILNKLIYVDNIFDETEMRLLNTHDYFCINLHTPIKNLNYYGNPINMPIKINDLRKYSIIHQYNRDPAFAQYITHFHKTYYNPI